MSDDNVVIPEWLAVCQNPYQIIQSVGHEIHNPLSKIDGFATLLLMMEQGKIEPTDVDSKELLQAIIIASHDIANLARAMQAAGSQMERDNAKA